MPMDNLSFDDTKVAYAAKTNLQLRKAHYLFFIVKNTLVTKVISNSLNLAIKLRLPVKYFLRKTVFEHFCGGESIKESTSTVTKLWKYNIRSVLDYSVEGKKSEIAFNKTLDETLKTIINATGNSSIAFCVFKPTGIGSAEIMEKVQLGHKLNNTEFIELEKIKARYHKLAKAAYENRVKLLIDAEDSWYQETVDSLVYEVMQKYNKHRVTVFNTYQMYRIESLSNLKLALTKAKEQGYKLGVKLVRGAYMENERKRATLLNYKDPICVSKSDTDHNYNEALSLCINQIKHLEVFSGTHNETSTQLLMSLMQQVGIHKNDERVYFSQLYGMSDNISYSLAKAKYNVAKYLPYGPIRFVMPYLIRRAEENSSVDGQSRKEITLIKQELERRKLETKL